MGWVCFSVRAGRYGVRRLVTIVDFNHVEAGGESTFDRRYPRFLEVFDIILGHRLRGTQPLVVWHFTWAIDIVRPSMKLTAAGPC